MQPNFIYLSMLPKNAAKNALVHVLEARRGESLLIICDENKKEIGNLFAMAALDLGMWARLFLLHSDGKREEIPSDLEEVIVSGSPDIFINIMNDSPEETPFRIKVVSLEQRHKKRIGHCPGINMDMMSSGAAALESKEYDEMQGLAKKLLHHLEGCEKVYVDTQDGTMVVFSVKDRYFFTDTRINWKTMKWMNLPVGEVIVAPVENSLSGKIVCDLAIGGIGSIKEPVSLIVKEGKVINIEGKNRNVIDKVKQTQALDDMASIIGEFAFGLNKKAKADAAFLEAEKTYGTVHFAFGNNEDYPGTNYSKTHMDFLISRPTVEIQKEDGKKSIIMKNGEYII